MAKESGIGMTLSVDDGAAAAQAITNDVVSLTLNTPRAVQDVTGLDKSAIERLLLLADASIALNMIFNDAGTTGSHVVFKTVPSTTVTRTTALAHSGQTLSMEMIYTDYSLNRGQDGSLPTSTNGVLQSGTAPAWS